MKNYTEQEKAKIASDLYVLAQYVHLIDVDNEDFEWEHYKDALEQAAEIISPQTAAEMEAQIYGGDE